MKVFNKMSHIQNYINELEQLKDEIKQNNLRNKTLRQRVVAIENEITNYLKSKDQLDAGITYKGKSITVESVTKNQRKKKKDKDSDSIELLKGMGILNPERAYIEILNIQKGDLFESMKLRMKNNVELDRY